MTLYFLEGRVARLNKKSISDNPYIDTTFESMEWDNGFNTTRPHKMDGVLCSAVFRPIFDRRVKKYR